MLPFLSHTNQISALNRTELECICSNWKYFGTSVVNLEMLPHLWMGIILLGPPPQMVVR